MSSIEQHLRALAPEGLRIHIFPTKRGFQVNVGEAGIGSAWTCVTDEDVIHAIGTALRQRCASAPAA